jgi:ribosomal protein S7
LSVVSGKAGTENIFKENLVTRIYVKLLIIMILNSKKIAAMKEMENAFYILIGKTVGRRILLKWVSNSM